MQVPRVRLLAIGAEILLGHTVDTNSAHLAAEATRRGLQVVGAEVVSDQQVRIVAAWRRACEQAELVLVTGGLGPTEDDRTRHALAEVLGVALEHDATAWNAITQWCERYTGTGRVPTANRRQALLPQGAQALWNDRGTAPGILARHGQTWIACFPGVPHEMYAMAERFFAQLPQLIPAWQAPSVLECRLAGIGESAVQDRLGALLDDDAQVSMGITAQNDGHLCIRAIGEEGSVQARLAEIRAAVGSWMIPHEGIAASLVQVLTQRGLRISAAESCTCGQVLAQLGAVPGASAVLDAGYVTYANTAKTSLVGVPETLLAEQGAVSEAVVRAMAEGARTASGADIAVATSGIAGPDGGTPEKPVGLVWMAASMGAQTIAQKRIFSGSRVRIQSRAASQALLLAWQFLQQQGTAKAVP